MGVADAPEGAGPPENGFAAAICTGTRALHFGMNWV